LELYLKYCDRTLFEHELLLYYPTEGIEGRAPFVARTHVLHNSFSAAAGEAPKSRLRCALSHFIRKTGLASPVSQLREVCLILVNAPTVWRLARFLRSGHYDIVHINNTFNYQPLTALACRLTGLPVVAHVRNPVPDSKLARLIARMSRMIVAVNAGLGRSIQHWCTRDVQICYDGVELGAANPEIACELRRTLLGDGSLLIGSVGRLELQKGYDLLVEAAKEVIATHPYIRFAIVGEGPLRGALEKRICEIGLKQNFHLCGFRSDIATFLQAVDIFVCSSRYEGGPYTVVEALMMSKPVVSTAVGFVPELTCDGRYADLVPVEDTGELAAAMERAIIAVGAPRCDTVQARDRAMNFSDPRLSARRFDTFLRVVGRH
jgi:glycosyltransferase involved in cell wall biosynthesis